MKQLPHLGQYPASRRTRWARLGVLTVSLGALFGAPAWSSPTSVALEELTQRGWAQRELRLSDLGVNEPAVFQRQHAQRDFYLPLPRGTPLEGVEVQFASKTRKSEDGRTTVVLSINGVPQFTRVVGDGEAALNTTLPVANPNSPSTRGFVRLGVAWQTLPTQIDYCQLDRDTGNALMVSPDTRLVFRHRVAELPGIDDAWRMLPAQPVVLLAGKALARDGYDTAWRLGAALQRAGKRPRFVPLPDVGDTVQLGNVQVPAALAHLPAFAALQSGGAVKLKSTAELAALLMVGGADWRGDLLVLDDTLRKRLDDATRSLDQQLQGDTEAQAILQRWATRLEPSAGPTPSASASAGAKGATVGVAMVGGRATLVVPGGSPAAVGLLDSVWRQVLQGPTATVNAAQATDPTRRNTFTLASVGASTAPFDVVIRGEWSSAFPLSSVMASGRVPTELVMDVAAAPGASATPPVLSVYWNDTLLGATQLRATTQTETLRLEIPPDTLGVTNVVRAVLQRQPVSARCTETPQPFPVQVLPSSYIRTATLVPNGSFNSLLPRLSQAPAVLVPERYLGDAPGTLPDMVRMAAAVGVAPGAAELVLVKGDSAPAPSKPFVAFDTQVQGVTPMASVGPGGHLQVKNQQLNWLDVSGLGHQAVAEVVDGKDAQGILWRHLGAPMGTDATPYLLSRGNVAVIGQEGVVAWLDNRDVAEREREDADQPSMLAAVQAQLTNWVPWLIGTLLAIALVVGLFKRAERKRALARIKEEQAAAQAKAAEAAKT